MYNFSINFSYPWLLLLLIPAVALTLIPYFRMAKKYRRNRNRVTVMVLNLIIMVLTVSVLSGIDIAYQVHNDQNEIILLVDVSDTEDTASDRRDQFIQTVLNDGQYDNYKIGIVTFGFDSVYAVPLTTDIGSIYERYLRAELPDTSATDIAAALIHAKGLFEFPQTGKIVLITDGKETDENAAAIIRSVAAQGTRVDTVYISSSYESGDVQLTDVTLPEHHVYAGEECTINVTLRSSIAAQITVELYDNDVLDVENGRQTVDINAGTTTLSFKHTFAAQSQKDLHKITFRVNAAGDLLNQNNEYNTYLYLQVFNQVLILERNEGESQNLADLLKENDAYQVSVINLYTSEEVPASVTELRAYDQIILNNISNADLTQNDNVPAGFDEMLYSYVYDFGGGLFTVGGNDETGEKANAYNREDLYGTLYQQMLPVQAINYTPPVGVMVIVDRSGSMADLDDRGYSRFDWALAGANACLDALTERDYFGFMTLDNEYEMILPLTPRTQEAMIRDAISSLKGEQPEGGTKFLGPIERAGNALRALKQVDKRHIVIVTDGQPTDAEREAYEKLIQEFYTNDGITLSIIGIGMTKDSNLDENSSIEELDKPSLTAYEKMLRAVILGHGRIYPVQDPALIVDTLRNDLSVPEIKEVNAEPFYPTVNNPLSPLLNGVEWGRSGGEDGEEGSRNKLNVQLGGFYGVKARTSADLILTGEYDVPIYAQWRLGEGMVGSFMCDLNGSDWSADFMNDVNGKKFICNIVRNLMPTEDIRPSEINAPLTEYNYLNQLSVITDLNSGETVQGRIVEVGGDETEVSLNAVSSSQDSGCYVTLALDASNNFSRCNFVIKKSGVYRIILTKCDAQGNALVVYETFKAFSYSQEYNTDWESSDQELDEALALLAARGDGSRIENLEDPIEIFEGFSPDIDREYDPKPLFILLTIILFLAEIAVRKFKFKWPHELIREHRAKKSSEQPQTLPRI